MVIKMYMDLREFQQRVDDLGRRARDLTTAYQGPVDTFITQMISDRFDQEGAAWGGDKWAALTLRTLNSRRRPGHGRGGILYDTGRLRASLVTGAGEGFKIFSPTQYVRGTTVPYAQYHDEHDGRQIFISPAPQVVTDKLNDILVRYILNEDLSGG